MIYPPYDCLSTHWLGKDVQCFIKKFVKPTYPCHCFSSPTSPFDLPSQHHIHPAYFKMSPDRLRSDSPIPRHHRSSNFVPESLSPRQPRPCMLTRFGRVGTMDQAFLHGVQTRLIAKIEEVRQLFTLAPMFVHGELCQIAFALARRKFMEPILVENGLPVPQFQDVPCDEITFVRNLTTSGLDRSQIASLLFFRMRRKRPFDEFLQRNAVCLGIAVYGDSTRMAVSILVAQSESTFRRSSDRFIRQTGHQEWRVPYTVLIGLQEEHISQRNKG